MAYWQPGESMKIDDTTALATRGKFARLCVEVDLTKPLLSKFRLRRKICRIEYESMNLVCFNCGRYGHGLEECKEAGTGGDSVLVTGFRYPRKKWV